MVEIKVIQGPGRPRVRPDRETRQAHFPPSTQRAASKPQVKAPFFISILSLFGTYQNGAYWKREMQNHMSAFIIRVLRTI
jgi:hypothetical protein